MNQQSTIQQEHHSQNPHESREQNSMDLSNYLATNQTNMIVVYHDVDSKSADVSHFNEDAFNRVTVHIMSDVIHCLSFLRPQTSANILHHHCLIRENRCLLRYRRYMNHVDGLRGLYGHVSSDGVDFICQDPAFLDNVEIQARSLLNVR